MGKVSRVFLTVAAAVFLTAATVMIHSYFAERGTHAPDPQTDDPPYSEYTYAIEPGTPPKLSTFIADHFESLGILEAGEQNDPDISVTFQPSANTDNQADDDEDIIDLYQIWGVTVPFSEYVHLQASSENFNESVIITDVSRLIDSHSPSELLGEFFPISVSGETEAVTKAKLITLQESTPDEIFIDGRNGDIPIVLRSLEEYTYPFIQHVRVSGPRHIMSSLSAELAGSGFIEENNYLTQLPDPGSFVTVLKTGTSVTGGPGWELCERVKGRADYPIDNVKDTMTDADISIISNETSFVPGCTQPAGTTSFCGKPSYLQNIRDMGVDVISLTGNHMADYGRDYFSDMLDLYTENDISYFGSGKDSDSAWEPLVIDTNAGKIAFIGYNMMGPEGVLAGENDTGAAYYDSDRLAESIEKARNISDIVWVDTHLWPEYGTTPSSDQISLSQEAIDLGADIVTGVSSHEIQGMTFYKNKPIFYGLGNFLFDQMFSIETRQGMALSVTLYEGRIVHIELLPTHMYDYCQPRFLEGSSRLDLIQYFMSISDL
jgi:poly-gamma-glutamate capsule biosynthesis protein CapA/YwtB (metallophosphatase superfamily)